MDTKIEETLEFIHSYAPTISDWKVLKKELLKSLHPEQRKLFSTRDPVTKNVAINEFELKIIKKWEKVTGIELYLG